MTRLWVINPESGDLRRMLQKGRPYRTRSDVYDLQRDLTHIERVDGPPTPGPDDLVAILCWPSMRRTTDLVPAWQTAMDALKDREPHLQASRDYQRSLRFWRARHPISDVPLEHPITPSELRRVLTAPRAVTKRPWPDVMRVLKMKVSGQSYVRDETRKLKSRVGDTEMASLIGEVERAIPDKRGRRPRRQRP